MNTIAMKWQITLIIFLASVAVTVICFLCGLPFFFLFLFLPLAFIIPFKPRRKCPNCGVTVENDANYCPICGTELKKE